MIRDVKHFTPDVSRFTLLTKNKVTWTFDNKNSPKLSGDVTQDGVVDGTDAALIDNDAFNFVTGYVVGDVNGDEIVDGSDAAVVDNNAASFVGKVTP